MRRFLVVVLLTLLGDDAFAQKTFSDDVVEQLNTAFTAVSGQKHVVNCIALVDANGGTIQWERAAGLAAPKTGEAMTTEHLFRTASVTKFFTGELDTPISRLLPRNAIPKARQLDDLHVLDGISSGEQIAIRQLLDHTSGLADYWFDEGMFGACNGRTWLDVIGCSLNQGAFYGKANQFLLNGHCASWRKSCWRKSCVGHNVEMNPTTWRLLSDASLQAPVCEASSESRNHAKNDTHR